MNPVVDPARLEPPDPDYAAATARLFAAQPVMAFLGVRLGEIAPGRVALTLPYRPELCQQDGFLHAGIVTTLLDNACGGAAFTLMPAGSSVLAVEFKVNLLAPAAGDSFVARAEVRRAGRTLSVCQAELFARQGSEKLVALMQATMMTMLPKEAA